MRGGHMYMYIINCSAGIEFKYDVRLALFIRVIPKTFPQGGGIYYFSEEDSVGVLRWVLIVFPRDRSGQQQRVKLG